MIEKRKICINYSKAQEELEELQKANQKKNRLDHKQKTFIEFQL